MNGLQATVSGWGRELDSAIAGTTNRETDRVEYVPKSM